MKNSGTSDSEVLSTLLVLAVGVWFFATHLWALWLVLGLGAVVGGLVFWWSRRPSVVAKRKEVETKLAEAAATRKVIAEQVFELFKSCPALESPESLRAPWSYSSDHDSEDDRFKGLTWNGWNPDQILVVKELSQCLADLKALVGQIEARKSFERQLLQIPTSMQQHIIGRRITRQLRMVRVDNCNTDDQADLRLREEAHKAGADGIINMKVRPYPGGHFSAEGDAVVLEKT